jgi:hypothetical protein
LVIFFKAAEQFLGAYYRLKACVTDDKPVLIEVYVDGAICKVMADGIA